MSEYVLELKGITKIFPGVKALNNVQFQLKPGEVHALMGENGAGKSTFIKVITGVHKAEEGEMYLFGEKVDFKGPKDAQEAGIAAVYQHPTSYPHLTVAENIFMGHEIKKNHMIQWKAMNEEANKLLKQLNADFDSTAEMGTLSVAQQQMVEIAKALSTNAKIVILDEPTASLTKRESEELYRIVDQLKEKGVSIIFISHRFEDMYRLASRVTVFRDSQYIGTYDVDGITNADLIKAMVGREIKDLLAYLRTVENGLDDISVKRIINVPKRGIGLTTIDRVADYALTHETSFYGALQNYEYIDGIKRSAGKLGSFVSLIESFKRHLASPEYSLEDLIREIIEETGYVRLLEEEDTEEANGRIENIEEFINKVVTYEENCEEEPTLSGFLEEVALVADIDTVDDDNNMVLLMTLHSAKGLEFPYVYLVGMEDGIFPGYAAVMGDDPEEMEEERRLCYVGITRAKQKLSLSCARSRFRNGEQQYNRPSSFLNEIPRYLLKQNGDAFQDSSRTASSPFSGNSFTESRRQSYHQVRMNELPNVRTNASSTWDPMAERSAKQAVRRSSGADLFAGNPLIRKGIGSSSQAGDIYRSKGSSLRDSSIFDKGNSGKTTSGTLSYGEGDRIKHKKFGEGTVIALKEKNGDHEVTVDFDNGSTRRMMASFAKLKKI